jgi:hypothetical protein
MQISFSRSLLHADADNSKYEGDRCRVMLNDIISSAKSHHVRFDLTHSERKGAMRVARIAKSRNCDSKAPLGHQRRYRTNPTSLSCGAASLPTCSRVQQLITEKLFRA